MLGDNNNKNHLRSLNINGVFDTTCTQELILKDVFSIILHISLGIWI